MNLQEPDRHFFSLSRLKIGVHHVRTSPSTVTFSLFVHKKKKTSTNNVLTPPLFRTLTLCRTGKPFAMFSSIQSAKRKVITFGDDGEQVSRSTTITAPTKTAATESSSSSSKKHNTNHSDTQYTNGKGNLQDNASSSSSSSSTVVSSASSSSEETGERLSKKQKRQLQRQNDARPRKLINKEPTTEAMTQKAKELKKHRNSLPIYTGKPMLFVVKEAFAVETVSF
jgi:hypothetical protein